MTTTAVPMPAPFVGDHLALDFVNSTATPDGVRVEWLADGAALLQWLLAAKQIAPADAERLRAAKGGAAALDAVARRARELRDGFRHFAERHAGRPLDVEAAAELEALNRLLAQDSSHVEVAADPEGGGLRLRRVEPFSAPDQLLQPIARAMAGLLCDEHFEWVRACEGHACTLMFLDRTKTHSRRWCSMASCGNRAKAAAHRARRGLSSS